MARIDSRVRMLAALCPALVCGSALGDTIVGDLTWAAGQPVSVTEDLFIQGTLTVEPGVVVTVSPDTRIFVQAGGTLDVDGTQAQPVVFEPASGRWDGVVFEQGSAGEITHGAIRGAQGVAVRVIGAPVTIDSTEISNVRAVARNPDAVPNKNAPLLPAQHGVLATDGAALDMRWSRVFDIEGPRGDRGLTGFENEGSVCCASDGADGTSLSNNGKKGEDGRDGGDASPAKRGNHAYGVKLESGATGSISYSVFSAIVGGDGGVGGTGGSGSRGGNGGDGVAFFSVGSGGNGGRGGDGGLASDGGDGGDAFAVHASDTTSQLRVYQNVFHNIVGGTGGKGGRAGFGAQGGSGGNGGSTDTPFVCGGDGGNGGVCGVNTDGGDGGDAGQAGAVFVVDQTVRAIVSQNTFANIFPGVAGDRGDRVNTTTGSFGGNGGSGGFGGCEGDDGSGQPRPNNSVNGSFGSASDATGMSASSAGAAVQIQAVNNIFSMGTTLDAFAFGTGGSAIIASDSNLFDAAAQEDFDTGTGTASLGFAFVIGDPVFVNALAGDFRLLPGSAAIDAGDSFNIAPLMITTDMDGNPRVFDDPDTANLAPFDPIDMGAFEFTVASACPADIDGDVDADIDDINAFVDAFIGGQADIDNDGDTDIDDINAFVAAFIAGCG